MKKLLLIAIILVSVLPAAVQTPLYKSYTIIPWPYGVVAWVQTPPSNAQQIVDQAVQAVNDVFSLWDQPTPTPANSWNQLNPMPQGAWNDAYYNPFIAGFLPVPSQTSGDIWEISLPTWGAQKILPLILIVFEDTDLIQEWTGAYTSSGLIDHSYAKDGIGTGVPLVSNRSLWRLVHRSYSIIYSSTSPSVVDILHHELGHWLFYMTCITKGIDPDAFPPLIMEGFAEYTACPSIRHSYWGVDAACWAVNNDLLDVPYFMDYH